MRAVLLLAFLVLPSVLWGQGYTAIEDRLTEAQRKATGLDTLTSEQLALLNRLLREKEQAAPAVAAHPDEAERHAMLAAEQRAITARLKGTIARWEPGTVFELDNGQKWKVLKGELTLRAPLEQPEVKVISGLAGRWFLQVDEALPKARVYRID
ncbi:hypothetical protein [Tahibacter amnicola]|uniref:Type IV pilus biogenesis protein PilP n=1 Tax=Tahibacter amnicola TaxID=2976241 RepID=A0ABY6BH66_9GAMM|nr:hypothetical protein [Tahibacter amnicola]UXI68926.1 hypothetical protein N4264_04520 [Tahibacter amnicola]